MDPLPPPHKKIAHAALLIASASFVLSCCALMFYQTLKWSVGKGYTRKETALQRIKREGVMRVGYAGFPPYAFIDPNEQDPNKRVKGFAADLVYEIANRSVPPLKVEWRYMSWDTLKADIYSRKFDFLAEPVYLTVPRAMDFGFSDPYSYFGIALALVRKDDNRFHKFADLDRPDITIAVAEGWVSSEYAKSHLSKPKFKSIPVGGDSYVQLDDVLMKRSDAALQDSPSVVQYAKAHQDKVKVLWLDSPPSMVPGCFAAAQDEADLLTFLSACIHIMKIDGTIAKLDHKWKTYGYFTHESLVPAEGLKSFLDGN
jgi:ABC-type amino acid transport substrate-binding protein